MDNICVNAFFFLAAAITCLLALGMLVTVVTDLLPISDDSKAYHFEWVRTHVADAVIHITILALVAAALSYL